LGFLKVYPKAGRLFTGSGPAGASGIVCRTGPGPASSSDSLPCSGSEGESAIRTFESRSFLLLFTLVSCASVPPLPEGFGGHLALEAWRGETSLHLKYTGPDGLIFALAQWGDQIAGDPPLAMDSVSLVVIDPDETGRLPWPGRPESARPLPVLHASQFQRFRDRVLSERVPRDGREAIVVALGDEKIALYFDPEGRFHSVPEEELGDVRVVERHSLEDYLALAPATLEKLLAEQGIFAREVLFNTGDLGPDALPFLYVNLDTNIGAFVRAEPMTADGGRRDTIIPITRSIAHFVRSHTTSLVNRPLTSLARLLFSVSYAVRDTFDGAAFTFDRSRPTPPVNDGPAMDLSTWESELDRMTGRSSERGRLTYLIDGEAFFPRLEQVIRGARKSVSIRIYIFDNDDFAIGLADLLRDRSNEGIEVRVLMDGIGTLAAAAQPPSELPEGYELPSSIGDVLEEGSRVEVRQLANPFFTGDHTKSIVIDEERAFVGGMNIGREYRYEWHDMMVEVTGPVVARLARDFDVAWSGAGPLGDLAEFWARLRGSPRSAAETGYPVRVLYTSPTRSEIRKTQLEAIRRSNHYIYLQNAYLTDDAFLLELVEARQRGVDVRVVIPLESDQGQLTRDNILTANALFENGVRVYIYPGMSHLKAAVFDGWACLGSANLDQLSLRINKETNLSTSEPEAVDALVEQLFEKDFRASPEMQQVFAEHWLDSLWELVGDYVF